MTISKTSDIRDDIETISKIMDLKAELVAYLVSKPSNPVFRDLTDSDYDDTEYLENTPFEYREEYLSAVESGVWS